MYFSSLATSPSVRWEGPSVRVSCSRAGMMEHGSVSTVWELRGQPQWRHCFLQAEGDGGEVEWEYTYMCSGKVGVWTHILHVLYELMWFAKACKGACMLCTTATTCGGLAFVFCQAAIHTALELCVSMGLHVCMYMFVYNCLTVHCLTAKCAAYIQGIAAHT